MLRLLIGSGLLLMTVGFGAAGWQYWQSPPEADPVSAAPDAAPMPARQSWLISPTGGLIPQEQVRGYLAQERFVPGRSLLVRRQASLTSLLAEGEKLPEPAFLQVLADIRAPKVADGLCDVVLQTLAADCAVHSARVVEGSVDPVLGTAEFQLELVYRLKEDGAELPDLAAHVLRSDRVALELEPGTEGASSPEAALQVLLAAVDATCSADQVGALCRPMQLALEMTPGGAVSARAAIAWLDPLPKGMFVAPPLDTVTGG